MYKTIIIALALIFISCQSGLEKQYKHSSKEEDLLEVSKQITKQELKQLKKHITELEEIGGVLTGKTYKALLIESESIAYERQQEIEQEKRKEEERVEAEVLKREVQNKTRLLCANKWKIREYAFQLEIPDNSEENVALAKQILNKAINIKDVEPLISVIQETNKTFVKREFDETTVKIFNNNNKRWKKYLPDGTYTDQSGDEVIKGTWEFVDANTIKETRPSDSHIRRKKKDIFFLTVKTLDENTFHFYEEEYDYLNSNSIVSSSIVMKS
ncbi:hypothetical protein [Aquimarina sp. I32.4]|uniref:hypothetical protein n=1 Tax=Aquimarina sp. I32.4 TaxID=2053903 RepID=UPI000CDE81C7|nr:hypothetical protein [Aquimarina sp. I32.4]